MLEVILHLYHKCQQLVALQVPMSTLLKTGLFEKPIKMKYDVPNDDLSSLDAYRAEVDSTLSAYLRK